LLIFIHAFENDRRRVLQAWKFCARVAMLLTLPLLWPLCWLVRAKDLQMNEESAVASSTMHMFMMVIMIMMQ
jgi:hypothetical protein